MNPFFEMIDDYMKGLLSPDSKAAFEDAMTNDPQLKHAVEHYHTIKKLSAALIEDETRQVISTLDKNKANAQYTTPTKKVLWMGLAAACLLTLIGYFALRINNDSALENSIVDNLYQYPSAHTTRGKESEGNKIDQAISSFKLNKIKEAKGLFTPRPSNDSLAQITDFYLAHIAFKEKNFTQSEALFKSLVTHKDFGSNAKINLLCTYLLTDQKEKAHTLFDSLSNEGLLDDNQKTMIQKMIE